MKMHYAFSGQMVFAASYEYSSIISFSIYIAIVFALAVLSNRLRKSKSFLSEYFLGSRSLGMWAFALTFAATSASGGSFMGFPSLVYARGWSVALWIAGYMLVPIVAMGLLAKRMNQFSRQTDSITIPELLRRRMESSAIGVLATWFIVFFMIFNLVAQFTAGSKILQTLLSGVPLFDQLAMSLGQVTGWIGISAEPAYLFCVLIFGIVVIAYTTYGGFRAVVWTDVLQGFFMVAGVLFMLPIALWAVGGLGQASQKMAQMTPPREFKIEVQNATRSIPKNTWLYVALEGSKETEPASKVDRRHLFRVKELVPWQGTGSEHVIPVVEYFDFDVIETADGIPQVQMQTMRKGKPGVVTLEVNLESESRFAVFGKLPAKPSPGKFVSLPGYDPKSDAFLPMSLAVSFFFFWTFSAAGQPSNMVRLMAFRGTATLKRAIFTVCIYYSLIYFPIVLIFCCARVLLPGWETDSDRIMPEMAKLLTLMIEAPWLAGVLVAAPFAAVMSTMDSFLLMISSSVVRDIYQRRNPDASANKIKRVTYLTTLMVGLIAMLLAINPPRFLQVLIIFTGGGLSTTFLAPVFLMLYWKRFNSQGAISAMIVGFAFHGLAYLAGTIMTGSFSPYYLFGFDPFVPGTILSFITAWVVTLKTEPPRQELVEMFFYRKPSNGH